MHEEQTGTLIDEVVILVVTEDGEVQEFVKQKQTYLRLNWKRQLWHLIMKVTMDLKDSKTNDRFKVRFQGESEANRRYLYFAQKADIEGANEVAQIFRSGTAEGETGHAHGHLEYLEEVGGPSDR